MNILFYSTNLKKNLYTDNILLLDQCWLWVAWSADFANIGLPPTTHTAYLSILPPLGQCLAINGFIQDGDEQ